MSIPSPILKWHFYYLQPISPSNLLFSSPSLPSFTHSHAKISSLNKPIVNLKLCSSNGPSPTTMVGLQNEIPPNALARKQDPLFRCGFSLGLDLGLSRTGLAISKGFTFRPLTVLNLRGQKLELRIMEIADKEEVDEFIIGLPRSSDGKETPQSNKVRSVAGRLAVRAAERGWRVYLQDEYGTSVEAMDRMINVGVSRSGRHGGIDAYAAVMLLERYFSSSGDGAELVWPKQLELQEKIRKGPPKDADFFN